MPFRYTGSGYDDSDLEQFTLDSEYSLGKSLTHAFKTGVVGGRQMLEPNTMSMFAGSDTPVDFSSPYINNKISEIPEHLRSDLFKSKTERELFANINQIKSGLESAKYMDEQHGFMSQLGLYAAATAIDPFSWTGYGLGYKAVQAAKIANTYKSIAAYSALGAGVESTSEAVMQSTGERDYEQVKYSAAFGAVLAGGGSALAHGLSKVNYNDRVTAEKELTEQTPNLETEEGREKAAQLIDRINQDSNYAPVVNRAFNIIDKVTGGRIKALRSPMHRLLTAKDKDGNPISSAIQFATAIDTPHISIRDTDTGKIVKLDKETVMDRKYDIAKDFLEFEVERMKAYKSSRMNEDEFTRATWEEIQTQRNRYKEELQAKEQQIKSDAEIMKDMHQKAIDKTIEDIKSGRIKDEEIEAASKKIADLDNEIKKLQEKITKNYDKSKYTPAQKRSYDKKLNESIDELKANKEEQEDALNKLAESKATTELVDNNRNLLIRREGMSQLSDVKYESGDASIDAMIDASNKYYGKMHERMIEAGIDGAEDMIPKYYSPVVYDVKSIKLGEKSSVINAFEQAIADSAEYKKMLADAEAKLEEYKKTISAEHVREKLNAEIKDLENKLNKEQEKILNLEDEVDMILSGMPDYYRVGEIDNRLNEIYQNLGGEVTRTISVNMANSSHGMSGTIIYNKSNNVKIEDEMKNFFYGEGPLLSESDFSKADMQELQVMWELAGKPPLKIDNSYGPSVGGYYDPSTQTLAMSTNAYDKLAVFKHELMHGITSQLLHRDKSFRTKISDIMDELIEVRGKVRKDGTYSVEPKFKEEYAAIFAHGRYASTNEHEFISELFSNKELVNILKSIQYKGKFKDGKAGSYTVFDYILESIIGYMRKVFKSNKEIHTVLDEVSDLLSNYTNKSIEVKTTRKEKKVSAATKEKLEPEKLSLEQERDKLNSDIRESHNKLEDAHNKMNAMNKKVDKMQEEIESKHNELLNVKDGDKHIDLIEAEANVAKLKDELDNLKTTFFDESKMHSSTKKLYDEYNKADKLLIDAIDGEMPEKVIESLEKEFNKLADKMQKSYLNKKNKIQAKYDEAKAKAEDIRGRASRQEKEVSDIRNYPKNAAEGVYEKIIGENNLAGLDFDSVTPNRLKGRNLPINVTHPALENYVVKNEAALAQMYNYTMSGRIATKSILGTDKVEDMRRDLYDNYGFRGEQLEDAMDAFELALGSKQIPSNPDDGWEQAARNITHFNYITMGGQFGLTALSEIGAAVYRTGFGYFDELFPAMTNVIKQYKGSDLTELEEMSRVLTDASAIVQNKSHGAFADNDYIESTLAKGIERGLKKLSNKMFRWSGLEGITTMTQVALPRAFLRRIIKEADNPVAQLDMLRWGIDIDDMRAIKNQPIIYENGKIVDFNFNKWDKDIANKFMRATQRMSRDSIMRPDAVRIPAWMSSGGISPLLKLTKQFMTFTFLSNERLLLNGLTERQAMAITGTMLSAAMLYGAKKATEEFAIATGMKDEENADYRGEEGMKKLGKYVATRQSFSGGIGVLAETINAFGTNWGAKEVASKFAGGPTLSRGFQIGSGAIDAYNGKLGTRNQISSIKSLIPYNNLFGANAFFDEVADDLIEDSKKHGYYND